jgi:acyl-coenzyme A thioesterase 13
MQSSENTDNPRLAFFRSQIGVENVASPSGYGRFLNGMVRAVEWGHLTVEYVVRSDMTNPVGTLHGGAVAGILDDLTGMMVYALGREFAYTSVNLNVDFLHSARPGDVLLATADVVRAGRNIVHCEARLTAPDGKIVAKCTTNLIQTGVKLDS